MQPQPWPWYYPEEIEVAPGVRWAVRSRNGELLICPELDPSAEPALIGTMVNPLSDRAYLLARTGYGKEARIELEAQGFVAYEPPIQTRVPLRGSDNFQHALLSYVRLQFYPRWALTHASEQCSEAAKV